MPIESKRLEDGTIVNEFKHPVTSQEVIDSVVIVNQILDNSKAIIDVIAVIDTGSVRDLLSIFLILFRNPDVNKFLHHEMKGTQIAVAEKGSGMGYISQMIQAAKAEIPLLPSLPEAESYLQRKKLIREQEKALRSSQN